MTEMFTCSPGFTDALQLDTDCGEAWAPPTGDEPRDRRRSFDVALSHKTVFVVDPSRVDAARTERPVFRTVAAAAAAAAELPAAARPVAVVLRGGTHYLDETLELTAAGHSEVTFMSAPGEQATMSGAVPLKSLKWEPFDVDKVTGHNIYVAEVGPEAGDDITGLRVEGDRAIRARYPNSDPEQVQATCDDGKTSAEGCPYIMAFQEPQNWTTPKSYPDPRTVAATSPNRYAVAPEFGTYSIGVGGACSVYTPPESYWCSNHTSGGGAFTFRTPSGLRYGAAAFPRAAKWSDPVGDGAIINTWRPSRWSNWMFQFAGFDPAARKITFGEGGFQGARGSDDGGDFFVENIREELDAAREFFFSKKDRRLYYFHNATAGTPIPPDTLFEATKLDTIVRAFGNQSSPIVNQQFLGVKFTGSAIQYMNPHGVPSGGDWALQRDAALFFEGTEGLNITGCSFERLDGNAIMLSGYTRNAVIAENSFAYIGDTVIASWGRTKELNGAEGPDGTDGNQPRGTQIVRNIVRENGHFSKQASPYFQAKTAQTTLEGNIFFNGPRAGINFNDGFGGGNVLKNNLVFNFCRESSDHGPFNSWDRVPFLTDVADPTTPSLIPLYNEIHHNFLIANYESSMCVDNDDGSAYYKIHDNVCHGGGKKSDFAGHSKATYNSLEIAPKQDACVKVQPSMDAVPEHYYNNTCIQIGVTGNSSVPPIFATFNGCNGTTGQVVDPGALPVMHSNSIYNPFGAARVSCADLSPPWGKAVMSFADYQAQGHDEGTTVGVTPPVAKIVEMARRILF